MPDFIEGVMNLRGQITTVINLKKRFKIDSDNSKNEPHRASSLRRWERTIRLE